MSKLWLDELDTLLRATLSSSEAAVAYEKYCAGFSLAYIEQHTVSEAVYDILNMEKLSQLKPISVSLTDASTHGDQIPHIKIYQYQKPLPLSEILPMLENMGLATTREYSYEVTTAGGLSIWISDYTVNSKLKETMPLESIKYVFDDLFVKIYFDYCENDGFNSLCLAQGLSWREICLIRAYSKYLTQTGFRFSQPYIERTLASHTAVTKALLSLFMLRHDPNHGQITEQHVIECENLLKNLLEKVTSLDEDRILRRFWSLINATLRTNFFQTTQHGEYKDYICFKFDSSQVPELPKPLPLVETFVYSTRFEGIHLRADKVARGGIRWSDRPEDFRTEVLGLMKAQKVKNAIIVPTGAKGGFVPKRLALKNSREEVQKEAIACYELFISALLDITDNIKDAKTECPRQVICHDGPDTYLVVAADKGTASFSDIANDIAAKYQFWLGDAFASGGSAGYDHKQMGITARGTWESIKRHFRELDINADQDPITVVGIGDMSGDVFGNGALYAKNMRLLAAFDHRHIFIDPRPNVDKAYQERLRMFKLKNSSWEDFDKTLISKGGGIFSRQTKKIDLSEETREALGITVTELPPNELIQAILRAPVDLLYNGGIGTYVKGSQESHDEVGDKTNEFCRINGAELRCKIVGEGGNLGFTQKGRIEFALQGGLINTDFIDNSAGVDCSDHEVNIKIFLNKLLNDAKLSLKERNLLLASMTEEVTQLVLRNNYSQALVMSFSSFHSASYVDLYQQHIQKLEKIAGLSRTVEFLPDDESLMERKARGTGLTRPEMAVVLAYTKIQVKKAILASDHLHDPALLTVLASAFPRTLHEKHLKQLEKHYLMKEIIATQLSNLMINKMGVTFPYRLQSETGSSITQVALAFYISFNIYQADRLQMELEKIEAKLPVKFTYQLLHIERQLLNMATRWFLRQNRLNGSIVQIMLQYREKIALLKDIIPKLIVGETKNDKPALIEQCIKAGLPQETAQSLAVSRVMYAALNIIEISSQFNFDLIKTAEIYFAVGGKFNLVWFRDKLAKDSREGLRNSLARLTLRDHLDFLQRQLTIFIMQNNNKEMNTKPLIQLWVKKHPQLFSRWEEIIMAAQENTEDDYTLHFIALHELANLINTPNEALADNKTRLKAEPAQRLSQTELSENL